MSDKLLQVEHLKQYFPAGGMGKNRKFVKAVDDVSFFVNKGETLGLVGESGCGKTTTGRSILRLYEPTGGKITFDGNVILDVENKVKVDMLPYRRKMQIVFQDPYSSLNPKKTIRSILSEGYLIHHTVSKKDLNDVLALLSEKTGISKDMWDQYPHELDGGKRQVVGIARALSMNPKFIVCDEPVSALDVSIQAQVLNLLMDLQEERGLTYMFVTHNLSVVKHISDEIAVMYLGQCVERCSSDELFENPLHPYTRALLSAIPEPSLEARNKKQEIIRGEVTSPINPKPGCRFAARCPFAKPECMEKDLEFKEVSSGHFVACILHQQ